MSKLDSFPVSQHERTGSWVAFSSYETQLTALGLCLLLFQTHSARRYLLGTARSLVSCLPKVSRKILCMILRSYDNIIIRNLISQSFYCPCWYIPSFTKKIEDYRKTTRVPATISWGALPSRRIAIILIYKTIKTIEVFRPAKIQIGTSASYPNW